MEKKNETILAATIEALIDGKKYSTLRDVFVTMQPADIAILFSEPINQSIQKGKELREYPYPILESI